jgi:hypothetical protein
MKTLYKQQSYPVFQNRMYSSREEAINCVKGDICLIEDEQTGLVYNAAFDASLMVYDAHYQNEQAGSVLFKEHLNAVLAIVERHMGRGTLVEIGCGKGHFMEMLLGRGLDCVGFDPAYEGENQKVKKCYFDPDSATAGDGLILRHVLEHIQRPYEFLLQLKCTNGGKGLIYIEVPCFDWICNRNAWFDVFYEHVNYFRLGDFHRMFDSILESGRLFGGQYIYIVADLEALRSPKINRADRVRFPPEFTKTIGECSPGALVWGGASKGVIFALLNERAGKPVGSVIDINPAKQGRYMPSTGLLVQSPADGLDALPDGATIYVMNSNYLSEIELISGNRFKCLPVDVI